MSGRIVSSAIAMVGSRGILGNKGFFGCLGIFAIPFLTPIPS